MQHPGAACGALLLSREARSLPVAALLAVGNETRLLHGFNRPFRTLPELEYYFHVMQVRQGKNRRCRQIERRGSENRISCQYPDSILMADLVVQRRNAVVFQARSMVRAAKHSHVGCSNRQVAKFIGPERPQRIMQKRDRSAERVKVH